MNDIIKKICYVIFVILVVCVSVYIVVFLVMYICWLEHESNGKIFRAFFFHVINRNDLYWKMIEPEAYKKYSWLYIKNSK